MASGSWSSRANWSGGRSPEPFPTDPSSTRRYADRVADADEFAEPATSAAVAGTTGLRYFGTDRAKGVGPHVTPEDRELLTLESGVTWQRLGQVPHHHVDFLLVTYELGSASATDGRLMRHNGTEYAYLISGELTLTLGFDQHVLTPGDSICFESTTPHGYRNNGEVPAVGVWFVVEPG